MTTNPDISIIIVSYNTKSLTLACLDSLFAESDGLYMQVIVVDNASADQSADAIAAEFPDVELHALDSNLGFGGANNYAAQFALSQHLLLLNPDTVILRQAIKKLLHYINKEESSRWLVGGRSYFADGSLNPSSCWSAPSLWSLFCSACGLSTLLRGNRVFDPESMGHWERDRVREVDIVTGCFLFIHKQFWDELGGFDTRFFMYGEDADLCFRAHKAGARLLIYPDAEFIHYAGASEPVQANKMVRLLTAKVQLFNKHWPSWKCSMAKSLLLAMAFNRMVLYFTKSLITRDENKFRDWRTIWIRRGDWVAPESCSER